MKIKEILKNKLAWILGIVFALFSWFTFRGYVPILGLPNLIPSNCTGMLGCGYTSAVYSNLIYMFILGFIVGLIINKLNRRFK